MTSAVIEALQKVAPAGVAILPETGLEDTGIDSLNLLEALLHLETSAQLILSEDDVRQLSIDFDYNQGMTVEAFADLLLRTLNAEE